MNAAISRADTSGLNLPEGGLRAGLGINCGECVVGNIGYQDKMDYTVIGDPVNLASRLEGTTKMYRHPLIVSDNVYNVIRSHNEDQQFIFRKADSVRVKGKQEPVWLYAVYGAFTDCSRPDNSSVADEDVSLCLRIIADLLVIYDKGLRLFYMRQWETAMTYFEQALAIDGSDYLTSLYLNRTTEFMHNQPPDDWDVSVTLTEK
jgi:adenylate cyclase